MKHTGRWSDRLSPNRDNPREVAFAEEWERENTGYGVNHTIDYLLYSHGHGNASPCENSCNRSELPSDLESRDRVVPQRSSNGSVVMLDSTFWSRLCVDAGTGLKRNGHRESA